MSDRERTRSRSGSAHSPAIKKEESPPNGRARGHSRSRSPVEHKNFKKSYSRSPSRSRKMSSYREERERPERSSRDERDRSERRGGERSRYRSRSRSSRSPPARKRRHVGTRENPAPSRCLGVFGLSTFTTEMQLYHIFSKYGPVESVQIVIDAKSGRSRGFGFVYFESAEDAKVAKEQCSGMEIDGRNIRVDFSITQRAHTPTPGIYMGKPTVYDRWNDRSRGRDRDDYYGGGYRSYRDRRSPSPRYRGRRYDRSRSRSYSPRFKRRVNGT